MIELITGIAGFLTAIVIYMQLKKKHDIQVEEAKTRQQTKLENLRSMNDKLYAEKVEMQIKALEIVLGTFETEVRLVKKSIEEARVDINSTKDKWSQVLTRVSSLWETLKVHIDETDKRIKSHDSRLIAISKDLYLLKGKKHAKN